jgi:hypothetical protein
MTSTESAAGALGAGARKAVKESDWLRIGIVCVLAAGGGAVALGGGFRGLAPRADLTAFGQLLAVLLFASAMLERALDVWLSLTMGGEADRLDAEIRSLKAKLTATPSDDQTKELKKLVDARTEHQSRTRRKALPLAMFGGLMISAIGLRALQSLFGDGGDPGSPLAEPTKAFVVVDVVLTGTLLAGGSDGIHWIVALYRDWMDKNRSTKS